MKKIFLSGDHAGFKMKEKIGDWTKLKGFEVLDFGPFAYNEKDDYPDFAKKVAKKVAQNKNAKGIVMCASGAGVCIATNRGRGVRAVLAHDVPLARASRIDDDTNILCIGSDFVTPQQAKKIISTWLNTPFEKIPRRVRRIKKLDSM